MTATIITFPKMQDNDPTNEDVFLALVSIRDGMKILCEIGMERPSLQISVHLRPAIEHIQAMIKDLQKIGVLGKED